MGVAHNPGFVTADLGLYVDAKNPVSCLDAKGLNRSLINTLTWTSGTSGGVTGYGANEDAGTENFRYSQTDPWGYQSIVWETRPSGNNNADGGWNTSWFNIDRTKLYRFSVWVRRTSTTTGGTFYFGMYGNGGSNVVKLSDQTAMNNPYWECSNISIMTQNQWYLWVGHVYPTGTTYTGRHPDTGYYTIASGKVGNINGCNIGTGDLAWTSDATQGIHRAYHFYCPDNTSRLQFAYPRVDLIDGTQPTINDLLTKSPGILYDVSGSGNNLVGVDAGNYLSTTNGIVTSNFNLPWRTPNTTALLNTDCHSVFFMIRFNSSSTYANGFSGNWEQILMFNPPGTDRAPGVWRYPSQRYLHWRYDPGNTGCDFGKNSSNQDFDINTWYYVGVTKNGSSAVCYVNGAQVSSATVASPKTPGNTFLYIFPYYTLSSANMGCLQVYNRPLSAAEVSQNFNIIRKGYGI